MKGGTKGTTSRQATMLMRAPWVVGTWRRTSRTGQPRELVSLRGGRVLWFAAVKQQTVTDLLRFYRKERG